MKSLAIVAALTLTGLAASALPAASQDLTAEVRTWGGQSLKLNQASFEVFYTIFPPQQEENGGGGQAGGMEGVSAAGARVGGGSDRLQAAQVFGSLRSIGALLDRGPEPMQGNKYGDHVTLYRGGVERRIPVASISSLTFQRRAVENSTLPPYVAPSHYRYAATATLVDGSRVEGDYVNLGTALLRGVTPEGRVDVPWQDIEIVRFAR
jgi:hypothetical protein